MPLIRHQRKTFSLCKETGTQKWARMLIKTGWNSVLVICLAHTSPSLPVCSWRSQERLLYVPQVGVPQSDRRREGANVCICAEIRYLEFLLLTSCGFVAWLKSCRCGSNVNKVVRDCIAMQHEIFKHIQQPNSFYFQIDLSGIRTNQFAFLKLVPWFKRYAFFVQKLGWKSA